MDTWPQWARVLVPVLVLLGIAALLIWLIGSFLGAIVKGVVGVAVLVGLVALVHSGLRDRQDTYR